MVERTGPNVRIGTLGASRIAPNALLKPASEMTGVEVTAVAARDQRRAAEFAALHNIPTVHDSYEALIVDDSIDAIYNPLVPSMHAEWSIKALERGKHVLCEKPFARNADEAAEMVRVARQRDRVLMEAFHWRYHPLAQAMLEIVGQIGPLQRGEAVFAFRLDDKDRWLFDYSVGGGASMDAGCYPIHWMRTLSGEEPEVVSASAVVDDDRVDVSMEAGSPLSVGFPSPYKVLHCRTGRTDLVPGGRGGEGCAPGSEPPCSTRGAPPYCGVRKRRPARRDLWSSTDVRLPTGGVPRGGTGRPPTADWGRRCNRKYGNYRQHLPSGRAAAALTTTSRLSPTWFPTP